MSYLFIVFFICLYLASISPAPHDPEDKGN